MNAMKDLADAGKKGDEGSGGRREKRDERFGGRRKKRDERFGRHRGRGQDQIHTLGIFYRME